MERNGQNYSFHADGLGSIIAITDASGLKVQSYSYDAFGNPTQTTAFRNSYLFTGREYDPETGLYYYRARYYDPMEGRFISRDPIGFRGGINLYNYVDSNPVNYTDPFGLMSFNCGSGFPFVLIIPDSWFGKYSFSDACQSHDKCYDTLNKPKKTCDDNFDKKLKDECSKLTGLWKTNCESIGASYVEAVRNLGNGAYCSAQSKARR